VKTRLTKVVSLLLCLITLFSLMPLTALAATVSYDEEADDYYKVVSQKEWDLAPGIVESELIINNAAGDRRQVMHVVEVDMNNEYTKVIPSSKGMIPTAGSYGVQTMDKQAAYAEANGYGNVVAAMNISLSWYDSAYYTQHPELVGEPLGYLVLDGVQYTNSQGKTSGAQTCLVINFDEKNGEARPADMPKVLIRSTSEPITGWEEQVIPANFGFLVKDGQMVYTTEEHTSEGAGRSMLGIKADGTIVMVMNDGRQAPYSTGFNSYEMSEAMLKLGCVYAINGDGGGSSQFLSQRPGEELELHCSPSDGSPRATTHGVLVISTAPSDGEFVRAHVESEHQYYTPGSTVQFRAIGADLAGGAAEIPAEATWVLSNASMGSIDNTGLFVSNGTTGTVSAQLVYGGSVVGSAEINIVVPDAIAFGGAEAYTVPFEESVALNVTATYGVFDVALMPTDYTISVKDSTLGTLIGNAFTAGDAAGKTDLTVTLNANASVSKTIPLTIGKGSNVIFDFEEGSAGANLNNWVIKDHENKYEPYADLAIVTSENGMVHNGETALAIHMPVYTRVTGGEGYAANSITWVGDPVLLENATAIGMWIYIPEEATQTEIALNYVWYNDNGVQQRTTPDLCLNDDFNGAESSGWYYLSVPISKTTAYIENATEVAVSQGYKRNFFLKFYVTNSGNAGDESSYMGDITYYIDDVTVDYSDAVEDRIAPVFSGIYAKSVTTETEVPMEAGVTLELSGSENCFVAAVSDNNAIDAMTASISVDGEAISARYQNGRILSEDIVLGAGVHRVVFEIADTMGNSSKTVRYISVAGNDVAVNVVPQNPELTTALTGSVYWLDVVAKDADKISKVTMKLDLDTMHTWELDFAELAYQYDLEYYYASVADEKDNAITVVLTNNGSDLSGNAVIASLPVRVWSYCGCESGAEKTPAQAWRDGDITAVSVNVEVEQGSVEYADQTNSTFSAEKIHVDTEAYIHAYKMDKTYFANNTYHVHTEEALADVAATCIKNGYTGRTYCEVCNSVVKWGEIVSATGHSIDASASGVQTCPDCEATYYCVDGIIQRGWLDVSGGVYYADRSGKLVDNEAIIDGHTYVFEDMILTAPTLERDGIGMVGWWAGKQMAGGWHTLNGKKYHVVGIYVSTGISKVALSTDLGYRWYSFDENGVWLENHNGLYDDGDEIIYAEKGVAVYAGLVQDAEGNYYYINSSMKAVKNCIYEIGVSRTNGLLPAGTYEFGADGKMVNVPTDEPGGSDTPEPEVKNGLVTDDDGSVRYYVDGVATYAGLVQDAEGNYYYINSRLKAVVSCIYEIGASRTNGLLPAGTYEFGADGKMVNVPTDEPGGSDTPEPEVKNGLVTDDDGSVRYYVDGVAIYAGLVQDAEGNYYYINSRLKAVVSCIYEIGASRTNGLLPAGTYEFGADGKMLLK